MKKTKIVSIIFVVALLLSSCGSNIPDGMHPDTYKNGTKALEIMDKYNSGDLSADETNKRLDALLEILDGLKIDDSLEKSENGCISSIIRTYVSTVTLSDFEGEFDPSLLKKTDELRKELELDKN